MMLFKLWKWSNFTVEVLKLQHVKGSTWLINICPTTVQTDAFSFSFFFFFFFFSFSFFFSFWCRFFLLDRRLANELFSTYKCVPYSYTLYGCCSPCVLVTVMDPACVPLSCGPRVFLSFSGAWLLLYRSVVHVCSCHLLGPDSYRIGVWPIRCSLVTLSY